VFLRILEDGQTSKTSNSMCYVATSEPYRTRIFLYSGERDSMFVRNSDDFLPGYRESYPRRTVVTGRDSHDYSVVDPQSFKDTILVLSAGHRIISLGFSGTFK
jgi:hypothetical protein